MSIKLAYSSVILSLFLLCSPALVPCSRAEIVSMEQAVRVADYWYTQEVNSRHNRLSAEERRMRLSRIGEHDVYCLAGGQMVKTPSPDQEVQAYIVIYKPRGFVIVSPEDRLEPIVAHSVKSSFRWDNPEKNFLRFFLVREMPKRLVMLRSRKGKPVNINPRWIHFRNRLNAVSSSTAPSGDASAGGEPLDAKGDDDVFDVWFVWDTPKWGQGDHYNEVVADQNGNNSNVPTGCTATAMAIKMRHHKWPIVGYSYHEYDDNQGDVQYHHSAYFGGHTYDWSEMPMTSLSKDNSDVARLMYHCGVAVEMDYEEGSDGGSGAWPSASAMNTYFRYHDTEEVFSDHDTKLIDSLRSGLPVVLSTSAHTVVADGYYHTITGDYKYHINCGWNGNDDGWYSLTDLPIDEDPTIDRSYPYATPGNYVYVNGQDNDSNDGTVHHPYRYLDSGVANTPENGQLWIKGGTYSGPRTFDKPMTITSYYGKAVIGSN